MKFARGIWHLFRFFACGLIPRYSPTMDFVSKLRRLTEESGAKIRVAQAAGMPPSAISNYLSTGQIPRADAALRLAKALNVPLSWLLDDTQGFPSPESGEKVLSSATDYELLREIVRRRDAAETDFSALLQRAEKMNWEDVATKFERFSPREKATEELRSAAILLHHLCFADAKISYLPAFKDIESQGLAVPDESRAEPLRKRWSSIIETRRLRLLGPLAFKDGLLPDAERGEFCAWINMWGLLKANSGLAASAPRKPRQTGSKTIQQKLRK